jgi:hypothetical protein
VPPEDKTKIKQLLSKPFNPYLRRQSSLSEKARLVNEYALRQHAGWTKNSDMIEIYTHELAGESSEDLLLAYGIDVKKKNAATATTINDKGENKAAEASSSLYPKACPHRSEPNKPTSKFCVNCQMVLTFDAFNETIEEAEKTKEEFEQLKKNQKRIEKTMSSMLKVLKVIMRLSNTVEIHTLDNDPPKLTELRKWQGSRLARSDG